VQRTCPSERNDAAGREATLRKVIIEIGCDVK
jgi:hypothetical protein